MKGNIKPKIDHNDSEVNVDLQISKLKINSRVLTRHGEGVINDNGCFSEDSGENYYNYQAIPKSFYPEYKKLTLEEINDVLLGLYINLEEV